MLTMGLQKLVSGYTNDCGETSILIMCNGRITRGRAKRKACSFQVFDKFMCISFLLGANAMSYMIDPVYAAIMVIPSVVFASRVGYLPLLISFCLIIAPPLFLLSIGDMDAFFILAVHSLFYLLLTLLPTEPFLLLTIHCLTSSLMLLDTPTTLSLVVAVVAASMAFGSSQVATDRVAVFLVSLTFATLMGHIGAIIACISMAIVLVCLKLRPLRLPVVYMLGLHLLGVVTIVDRHLAFFVALTMSAIVLTAFLVGRLKAKFDEDSMLNEGNDNGGNNHINNNNNNNNINPTSSHLHNGCLQLSNPTDSLDLQCHTVTSALQALHQFLAAHEDVYKKNRTGHIRHLKVITGEGGYNASQEMVNLIKPTVANFLKINKYRFDVSRQSPGIIIIDMESHAL